MRVLVAEDDRSIAAALCASLRESGHAVDHISDGALADAAVRENVYDLIVLDLGLPSLDGSEVLARMRHLGNRIPVLAVTAREGLQERIRVLDLGADDYLVKPFALGEMQARVRALLRRVASQGTPDLRVGRLRLDFPGRRAHVEDRELDLTARDFGLLEAMVLRSPRVISRAQLIDALCSWDEELTDNGLDIAIHRLRKKLHESGTTIRTMRGIGYLFEEIDSGRSANEDSRSA